MSKLKSYIISIISFYVFIIIYIKKNIYEKIYDNFISYIIILLFFFFFYDINKYILNYIFSYLSIVIIIFIMVIYMFFFKVFIAYLCVKLATMYSFRINYLSATISLGGPSYKKKSYLIIRGLMNYTSILKKLKTFFVLLLYICYFYFFMSNALFF